MFSNDSLQLFRTLRDNVVGPIEAITIFKDKLKVGKELTHAVVTRLLRAGRGSEFWFLRRVGHGPLVWI